jgi:septal ring factor EnvC (AmiA/AmiB activator)
MISAMLASKRFPRKTLTLVMAITFGVAIIPARGEDIETNRRQLQALRAQIAELGEKLATQSQEEHALNQDLSQVEEALAVVAERIASSSRRLKELDAQEFNVRAALVQTSQSITATEGLVRLRLTALYKRSDAGAARMLFSGDGPARIAEDFEFFQRIVRRDRELLTAFRSQLRAQQNLLAQLEAVSAEQRNVHERRQQERSVLREAAVVKDRLLVKIRNDRRLLADKLDQLRAQAAELQALVKSLESTRSAEYSQKPTLFAAAKGHLPWPAPGKVRVGFGTGRHPELGTIYQSQGLELKVPGEQSVSAVWPGRVVFASPFRGYGNLLILDHGDGYYTLYAQISGMHRKVGDQVAAGDLLAIPGGDNADRLYFEIRKGSSPLDPSEWLQPRR